MKFIHRVGYYLGGFSIGLIILAFFLQGKKASCDYGPNARTTKNIANKSKSYTLEAQSAMENYKLDSLTVSNLIRFGTVDFSKSKTKTKDCQTYYIENSYKENQFELLVKNCDTLATVESITIKQ